MPELIDRRRLARGDALGELHERADGGAAADGVLGRDGLDLDDADAGVVGPAVVDTVAEVAEPGLEDGRVKLLDGGTVGDDGGAAGDGRPFARGRQESDVDVGVVGEVVGFAGFGVGVEEEVDAVAFLWVY